MAEEVDEFGFELSEDQSLKPDPIAEDWQAGYNRNLRESWLQGHKAQGMFPDMTVDGNPYIGRGDDLISMTRALGWESGFVAAESGKSVDDCPYP